MRHEELAEQLDRKLGRVSGLIAEHAPPPCRRECLEKVLQLQQELEFLILGHIRTTSEWPEGYR